MWVRKVGVDQLHVNSAYFPYSAPGKTTRSRSSELRPPSLLVSQATPFMERRGVACKSNTTRKETAVNQDQREVSILN